MHASAHTYIHTNYNVILALYMISLVRTLVGKNTVAPSILRAASIRD